MIIKDNWGRRHFVNNNYDQQDLITNPPASTTFELPPENLLNRPAYNWNSTSTRVNETRPVTLINLKEQRERRLEETNENW